MLSRRPIWFSPEFRTLSKSCQVCNSLTRKSDSTTQFLDKIKANPLVTWRTNLTQTLIFFWTLTSCKRRTTSFSPRCSNSSQTRVFSATLNSIYRTVVENFILTEIYPKKYHFQLLKWTRNKWWALRSLWLWRSSRHSSRITTARTLRWTTKFFSSCTWSTELFRPCYSTSKITEMIKTLISKAQLGNFLSWRTF